MKRALILVAFAVTLSAQMKWAPLTGRLWIGLGPVEKTFYVQGIYDGILGASKVLDQGDAARLTILQATSEAPLEDYVHEIDKVYADRENLVIPVPYVYAYCTVKLKGIRTKAQLEESLIGLRKDFAGTSDKETPK